MAYQCISEEKAYWLGLIAADGHISRNGESASALDVTLALQDKDHVQKLQRSLQSTHPVSEYRYPSHSIAKLFIRSEQMTNDLVRYGITPAKTLTHIWPDYLSGDLLIHFVRGYVDGDGGFHRAADNRRRGEFNYNFEVTEVAFSKPGKQLR